MPARGDHDARRRDVSAAVWSVLAARGFGGLTLRAVAAEMGASTGLLTHYFPTKRALLRHALEIAEERTDERDRRVPAERGLEALRASLLDVLPLTPESTAMSRVWVSFWDGALGDPVLAARQRARYERWRERLRGHVEAAQEAGQLPAGAAAGELAVTSAAFAHGLVVQTLFAPDDFPPDLQTRVLDRFLTALGGLPATA
ncbi:TetR/AcrR family transcriptional regulator [Actinomadura sp. DC4]|uniref:TetR/AcrR family transcriptional regulator n=1 Tax=Actinomadura sp. DC4 TaxID=3055069 RepID=UPI0025B0309A|nr:TetR/AcrR family transcriptional regulator [Actinomadura sp. DC4]MDN3357432.1 TetR/AcrR family transcriptional regulator [Actinomadura sp. DC4]